jgi:hypothetical protein
VTCARSADGRWIEQRHRLVAAGRPVELAFTFDGRLRRAAFAEITEVAPPAPLASTSRLECAGTTLTVVAAELATTATIEVTISGESDGWRAGDGGARLVATSDGVLDVVVRARLEVADSDGTGAPARPATIGVGMPELPPLAASDGRGGLLIPAEAVGTLERIRAGAARYTLGCCACPVAPGEVAILTDHRLLPLSWTRDAYFQALLLLSLGDTVATAVDTVADHLRWLWHRAHQPGVGWLRAHYAHGAVKDPVRQADQQLYPLLELVDYRRLSGAWPRPPDGIDSGPSWWGDRVAAAWRQLPRHRATGMLAAAENPADDPLELPLLASTQALWWNTATWLASYAGEIGVDPDLFAVDAERVRARIDGVFAADGPFGAMWAYAADGSRTSAPYADANDVPIALAPLWGVCAPDDQRWVATMRFAFSPENPGYESGQFGGLGSRHTAGTWPLGDLQEWIAASLLGEPERVRRVLQRVERVAAPDGMLPESYDPHTANWRARHWFAWPGAAFGVITAVALGTLDLAAPDTGAARTYADGHGIP